MDLDSQWNQDLVSHIKVWMGYPQCECVKLHRCKEGLIF